MLSKEVAFSIHRELDEEKMAGFYLLLFYFFTSGGCFLSNRKIDGNL